MTYMLDTTTCIYIIKNKPEEVIRRFMSHDPDEICIFSVTYSELLYGIEKSAKPIQNRLALILFLSPISILSYDTAVSEEYGRIRLALERAGTPIGSMDLMIAAHALSKKLIIVTNNTREFERVPGLQVENWVD